MRLSILINLAALFIPILLSLSFFVIYLCPSLSLSFSLFLSLLFPLFFSHSPCLSLPLFRFFLSKQSTEISLSPHFKHHPLHPPPPPQLSCLFTGSSFKSFFSAARKLPCVLSDSLNRISSQLIYTKWQRPCAKILFPILKIC